MNIPPRKKGFTLVELMVSLAIFALMTALLVAKYSSFNQGIILTNLAYDVALLLRTSQSYGLNVKSVAQNGATFSPQYSYPYGVHFDRTSGNNTTIDFFSDQNSDGYFTGGVSGSEFISLYTLKGGSTVSALCTGNDHASCSSAKTLDVTYKRPDPNAIINSDGGKAAYAEITVKSSSGSTKKIIVTQTGQIAVSN